MDFGPTVQAATFFAHGVSFFDDGAVEVYEILPGGTESLLGTLNLNTGTGWSQENNFTTSARSGNVKLRLKIVTAVSTNAFFAWTVVMPAFVSVQAPPQGGDRGESDPGCSTGGRHGIAFFGLTALVLLAAARLQGSRQADRA
jgi:hypothetical protein